MKCVCVCARIQGGVRWVGTVWGGGGDGGKTRGGDISREMLISVGD